MSQKKLPDPEPLSPDHMIDWFDCGDERLNKWLCNTAGEWHRQGRSKTFVMEDGGSACAYFTLSQETISVRGNLPSIVAALVPRGFPRNKEIPSILLGKLALDSSLHGQHVGMDLLAAAILKAKEAADIVGGVFLLVDPADGVSEFYEKAGFNRVPNENRMYLSLLDD